MKRLTIIILVLFVIFCHTGTMAQTCTGVWTGSYEDEMAPAYDVACQYACLCDAEDLEDCRIAECAILIDLGGDPDCCSYCNDLYVDSTPGVCTYNVTTDDYDPYTSSSSGTGCFIRSLE